MRQRGVGGVPEYQRKKQEADEHRDRAEQQEKHLRKINSLTHTLGRVADEQRAVRD